MMYLNEITIGSNKSLDDTENSIYNILCKIRFAPMVELVDTLVLEASA
jgi:hypothetical protein